MTATAMTAAMTASGFHGMPPTSVVGAAGGTLLVPVGRGRGGRDPELVGGLPVGLPGGWSDKGGLRDVGLGPQAGHAAAASASGYAMAPVRSASPRMTPATPASRERRRPSRSRTPPASRISASYVRTSDPHPLEVRRRAAVAQDEAAHARPDQLPDECLDGRWRRPSPGIGGQPLRPRIQPHREPIARDREACPQLVGLVGDVRPEHGPRRAGREDQADRVGGGQAAGDLDRDGDPRRDGPDRLESRRGPRRARRRNRRGGSAARPSPRRSRRCAPAGRWAPRPRRPRRASRPSASARRRGRSRG